MNLYKIIGLTVTTFIGNSYETRGNRILQDETGKGVTKDNIFTKYVLYIVFENKYYAIHLSEEHRASFGGRLCHYGIMSITQTNYTDIISTITHIPIKTLVISAEFEVKSYNDDLCICLHTNPDTCVDTCVNTCVFEFSSIGDNERDPYGYVYVNMDLFHKW